MGVVAVCVLSAFTLRSVVDSKCMRVLFGFIGMPAHEKLTRWSYLVVPLLGATVPNTSAHY